MTEYSPAQSRFLDEILALECSSFRAMMTGLSDAQLDELTRWIDERRPDPFILMAGRLLDRGHGLKLKEVTEAANTVSKCVVSERMRRRGYLEFQQEWPESLEGKVPEMVITADGYAHFKETMRGVLPPKKEPGKSK